jgi:hypothetical protein
MSMAAAQLRSFGGGIIENGERGEEGVKSKCTLLALFGGFEAGRAMTTRVRAESQAISPLACDSRIRAVPGDARDAEPLSSGLGLLQVTGKDERIRRRYTLLINIVASAFRQGSDRPCKSPLFAKRIDLIRHLSLDVQAPWRYPRPHRNWSDGGGQTT